jgi:4-amino-4-deoxy-L-arabinose transferase-like glycosyltransferase
MEKTKMSITLKFDYKQYIEQIYSFVKKINIAHILLVVLVLHAFLLSIPSDGKIFDESAYVPASIATVNGIAANAEHTPLSKLVIGWSIQAFGDWWFAWRITPVLFSTLSVLLVYLISRQFLSKKYSLFAATFIGLDMLFFVNGSIAILDAQAVAFALAGVWLLLKKRYAYSAVMFGIGVLSKETSVLILFGSMLYLFIDYFAKKSSLRSKFHLPNLKVFKSFMLFLILFGGIVLGGVYAYDIVYHPSSSAVSQTIDYTTVIVANQTDPTMPSFNESLPITTVHTTSTNNSNIAITNPIQHFIFAYKYYAGLTPTINPAPQDLRPAWSWALPLVNAANPPQYYGVAVSVGDRTWNTVAYWSQVNYPVTIFIVPSLALCFFLIIKKKLDSFGALYLGWLAGTYLPWILFSLFIQKMTFNYYFMYTVPILAVGAPWFISKLCLKEQYKTATLLCLTLIVGIYFMYYFPLNLFRA